MAEDTEKKQLSAVAALIRNPLSVIAMFVLLVEAIATVTLVQISEQESIVLPLVWFIVLFPTLIALLFFSTLWWRHQFLYSPMEYRSDESFLAAMHRLQRVEARQEAAELNPRTADETQSRQVVDRLMGLGDVRTAVKVGRTFLEAAQYDVAARLFRYILDKTPKRDDDRYNVLANLGYAQIGMGEYDEAVSSLAECISLLGERSALPWHYVAIAYAHFKLSAKGSDAHRREFKKYLDLGKRHRFYSESRDFFMTLYPEIADQL